MDRHLGAELSAYLDEELDAAERAGVELHLRACPSCTARVAELRGAARLIAALPMPRPTRSLVPRIAPERVSWLRPLRSLSLVASGAFVLMLMASTVLETDFRMGGAGAPTSAQGARSGGQLLGSPAPEAAIRTVGPGSVGAAGAPAATPAVALDASRSLASPTAVPQKAAEGPTGASAQPALGFGAPPSGGADAQSLAPAERPRLGSPWLWLILSGVSAAFAFAVHRRLRSA